MRNMAILGLLFAGAPFGNLLAWQSDQDRQYTTGCAVYRDGAAANLNWHAGADFLYTVARVTNKTVMAGTGRIISDSNGVLTHGAGSVLQSASPSYCPAPIPAPSRSMDSGSFRCNDNGSNILPFMV